MVVLLLLSFQLSAISLLVQIDGVPLALQRLLNKLLS